MWEVVFKKSKSLFLKYLDLDYGDRRSEEVREFCWLWKVRDFEENIAKSGNLCKKHFNPLRPSENLRSQKRVQNP